MEKMFPRTEVAGISLPRMLIGTNWMAGWSHRTPAADQMIVNTHSDSGEICRMLETNLEYGVDAIMGLFDITPIIVEAIETTKDKTGKDIIMIDTPIINIEDSADGRREAEKMIKRSKELGATFCLIHHSSVEQLVNKGQSKIDRLDDYTRMIRDAGLIPGLSAHMPELIMYSDINHYDVETYIQLYNCLGFLMQMEVEIVNQAIQNAKKPVMTIKPMAAGRTTPFVGLNFAWATLRDCDMVTVGCLNERETREDIEISLAALEGHAAKVGKRNSPNNKQDSLGK